MFSVNTKWSCIALTLALAACGGGSDESASALSRSSDNLESTPEASSERETESFNEANAVIVNGDEGAESPSGQATGGLKSAIVMHAATPTTPLINLGAPAPEKITEIQSKNRQRGLVNPEEMQVKAYQIGFTRPIPGMATAFATMTTLRWVPTAAGGYYASVQLRSEGARMLRIGMRVEQLPASAMVRVLGEDGSPVREASGSVINEALARNRQADGNSEASQTYWLPGIMGDTALLEIELPPGTNPSLVQFALPQLAHGAETAVSVAQDLMNARSACEWVTPDATCSLATSANAINASASYDFMIGGGLFSCSGTLIADKAGSPANYFLTAHHCVNTQTQASTVDVYWFNRSTTCGGSTANAPTLSSVPGATYLFGQSIISPSIGNPTGTDTSLLRLTGTPPVGAVKAGWTIDRQPISNTSLTGIHHPAPVDNVYATLARRSDGRITSYASALFPTQGGALVLFDTNPNLPLYTINWTSGITEPGSSGSALFRNANTANPQVVAQLYGGSSSCSAPSNPDIYGRFDIGYEDGMINWLNPGYRMVFRMYNTQAGVHFYTANVSERNTIRQTIPTYLYEGSAFTVRSSSDTGLSPVFRFYNRRTGTHFYTISASERDLVMTYPTYSYEGIAWYARQVNSPAAGTIAIYRFYHRQQGTHFYTASAAERDNVIANLSGTYDYEGIAYRAWPRN